MLIRLKTRDGEYFKEYDDSRSADMAIQGWVKNNLVIWDDGKVRAVFPMHTVDGIFLEENVKKTKNAPKKVHKK